MLNIAELSKIRIDDLSKFISSKISSLDHQILLLEYKNKNNLSFGIFENKNLVAICPVSYEKKENYNIGTFFNISLPGPLINSDVNEKKFKEILNFILDKIDDLCIKNNIAKIKINFFDLLPSGMNDNKFYYLEELLHQYNYISFSLIGSRLHLKKDMKLLENNISKGHKAIIKKEKKIYKFLSFVNHKINFEDFDKLVKNYIDFSEYSSYLFKLYCNNQIDLIYDNTNDKLFLSGVFVKVNKTVEYFLAINSDIGGNHHSLIHNSINYYKKIGFEYMNLGVINYNSTPWFIVDKKKENISIFKRGFGGDRYGLNIYGKYYSKESFINDNDNYSKNYLKLMK